ncbi:hypothetical protein F4780DRAFT_729223 [Xylariomycetidae sp. FL0641]|nr:hypothetical protein F4780DRAFT_729223 [Xylariomycetidae sp. FL0641]
MAFAQLLARDTESISIFHSPDFTHMCIARSISARAKRNVEEARDFTMHCLRIQALVRDLYRDRVKTSPLGSTQDTLKELRGYVLASSRLPLIRILRPGQMFFETLTVHVIEVNSRFKEIDDIQILHDIGYPKFQTLWENTECAAVECTLKKHLGFTMAQVAGKYGKPPRDANFFDLLHCLFRGLLLSLVEEVAKRPFKGEEETSEQRLSDRIACLHGLIHDHAEIVKAWLHWLQLTYRLEYCSRATKSWHIAAYKYLVGVVVHEAALQALTPDPKPARNRTEARKRREFAEKVRELQIKTIWYTPDPMLARTMLPYHVVIQTLPEQVPARPVQTLPPDVRVPLEDWFHQKTYFTGKRWRPHFYDAIHSEMQIAALHHLARARAQFDDPDSSSSSSSPPDFASAIDLEDAKIPARRVTNGFQGRLTCPLPCSKPTCPMCRLAIQLSPEARSMRTTARVGCRSPTWEDKYEACDLPACMPRREGERLIHWAEDVLLQRAQRLLPYEDQERLRSMKLYPADVPVA